MLKKCIVLFAGLLCISSLNAVNFTPQNVESTIFVKAPGNAAVRFPLKMEKNDGSGSYTLKAAPSAPLSIVQQIEEKGDKLELTIYITACKNVYIHFSQKVFTGFTHNDCLFLMPGFWYRKNLRSPKEAPSFRTSDSWTVREDRLSTPLTGIFNEKNGDYVSVMRIDSFRSEALTPHYEGEAIVSGKTSVGFTGFENINDLSTLSFGFPYEETPKSYIRKLTLAPSVKAFQEVKKGETIVLKWEIKSGKASDYSDFVKKVWEYSYDTYKPTPVDTSYTIDYIKENLASYFAESFVGDKPLKFSSGAHLVVANCEKNGIAEVGFVGRVLLNAFNALEYGEQNNRFDLIRNSNSTFDSYLQKGLTSAGFFREFVDFDSGKETDVFSIRRQSEGLYAIFHYLQYEKDRGRRHPEWETHVKKMLEMFLKLQNIDGHFPRKFRDNLAIVDESGGSTPSATLPMVMAYKYFKDKRYLKSAINTAKYLEKELIQKADYFSSTLDANCEDKEASLYASTATYYLALVSKGAEQKHYADLSRKAAYFTLSWYYTWDVPFAQGQMLGDLGFKTRGWGNVSVENNHIDVFVFEFASVLNWLSKQYNEPRFAEFSNVIQTSMRQLLPCEGHLCGIAKKGYYPEVVQHTNWDYGKNGKGFYNDIFAPGWVVASLWELFTPGRTEYYLRNAK